MRWIETAWRLFYFRIVVAGALQNPVATAGLLTLATHFSLAGFMVAGLALVTAYTFPNALLFWQSARDKGDVLAFLKEYGGSKFIRIPSEELVRYFEFSFLLPAFVRPSGFVRYFLRSRVHVFLIKRGVGPTPGSAAAFVSPIAQDAYIFLRDALDEMSAATQFRLMHELGHAAGIYQVTAQRNVIGLAPFYISIAWIALSSTWTFTFLIWTSVEILFAVFMATPVFRRWKSRQHLNGELVADYMAARHLPADSIHRLIDTGIAAALIHDDKKLTPDHNKERRSILSDQFAKLDSNERIDIPDTYMKETFNHPAPFVFFLFAHLCYIVYFSSSQLTSPWIAALFALIGTAYFAASTVSDAYLRIEINSNII